MRAARIFLLALAVSVTASIQTAHAYQKGPIKDAVYTKNSKDNPYLQVSDEPKILEALELLTGTSGEYSKEAILGKNVSGKPMKVVFQSPGLLNPAYGSYDALGWKSKDQLYIYINPKHRTAPPEALASLLSHEAMHQDQDNSINEETYAWTLEAAVWTEFTEKNPELKKSVCPLVSREATLSKLLINANYSNKYIRQIVTSNPGYQNLPLRSPGFENVQ